MEQLERLLGNTPAKERSRSACAQLESHRQQLHSAPPQPQLARSALEEDIFRQVIGTWIKRSGSATLSRAGSCTSALSTSNLGRPLKELYGSDSAWAETIHPDDRARVLKAAFEDQAPEPTTSNIESFVGR